MLIYGGRNEQSGLEMSWLVSISFPVQHICFLLDPVFVDQGIFFILHVVLGMTMRNASSSLNYLVIEGLPTICYNILQAENNNIAFVETFKIIIHSNPITEDNSYSNRILCSLNSYWCPSWYHSYGWLIVSMTCWVFLISFSYTVI